MQESLLTPVLFLKITLKGIKYMYKVLEIDHSIITAVTHAEVPLKVHFTAILKRRITDTIQNRHMWISPWFVWKSLYTAEVVERPLYTWKWSPKLPGTIHYHLFLFTVFPLLLSLLFFLTKRFSKLLMGIRCSFPHCLWPVGLSSLVIYIFEKWEH